MYTLSAAAERSKSYLSLTGCNLLGIRGLHQVMRVRIAAAHPLQLDADDEHMIVNACALYHVHVILLHEHSVHVVLYLDVYEAADKLREVCADPALTRI